MTEQGLINVSLTQQVKEDYLAYSMAVLVGRAVPDLYDGLKPAQRRVLQVMSEEGLTPDKRYVKTARVTGLTQAYLHPHGDCYGTLVNMATTWNNNVPWIDGHGNFGSTTDGPASSRYTECKLRSSAVELLLRDKETWETRPNYDGSRNEAVRFNTAVPSVLLNGDSGIAVGFATKLAPHGLRSIVKALVAVTKGKLAEAEKELTPDFPTGCDIVEDENLQNYRKTGSGAIRCRARVERSTQERSGRAKNRGVLSFTQLPPQINPEKLGEQVRDGLEKGRIENVAEVVDESDRFGDRFTVVAKPGADLDLLEKQLYAYTDLDTKYSAKTLVIDGTTPVEIPPVEILNRWLVWRLDRLQAKFTHELSSVESRLHIVEGLLKAIDKLDLVIKRIRESKDKAEARTSLMKRPVSLSEKQADAVLEMRLRQLTGLDSAELEEEKTNLLARQTELKALVENKTKRTEYLVKEVQELAKRHGEARRSQLVPVPSSLATTAVRSSNPVQKVAKPRYLKVDLKKGTVEQVKGPRGAFIVQAHDKVVLMTEDGTLKKVGSNFKGAISDSYSPVTLVKTEAEVSQRRYLAVFRLEGQLKAMTIPGETLTKTTSKGKKWLPDGAEFVYFGEGDYTVQWSSKRKKPLKLSLDSVKEGKPGAKGVKVAALAELAG